MYSAYAVANAFIRRAQDGRLSGLNSMKLQKLMYFAQAWHLKVTGVPLIDDTFIRCTNGPILPSVHHQVKRYGMRSITQTIRTLSGDDDQDEWWVPILKKDDASALDLVDVVSERYGCLSWRELSALTHLPGSAWSLGEADDSPITNDQIRDDPTL